MKKPLAATAIAATAIGGAAAGAAWFTPVLAGAQDTEGAPAPEVAPPSPEQRHEKVRARISEALQPLVDDGTLTEAQRDAVIDALEAARPERPGRGDHDRGPRLRFDGDVAEILGMDPADVGAALRDGQTLADLAEANGVDPREIVDAIVDDIEARIEQGVENGRLDEDRAAEILANAEQRATDIVNGEFRPHRPGPGGPDGTPPGDA